MSVSASDSSSSPHETSFERIKAILESGQSFASGTMPLRPAESMLFYREGLSAWCIDLARATEDRLQHLSEICAAATFGRNKEDVLDETYRKARKLDRKDFACHYDPVQSGLVRAACDEILVGTEGSRPVRAELYKLNIYGPGSFFKPHKDTPRARNMFGSLVVVFPTQHDGGALILRPRGSDGEISLDFAQLLSEKDEPHVAYACFYSDVEHEVYEVTKGYRVTLTYNLYFADDDAKALRPSKIDRPIDQLPLFELFSTLLDDPTFLPNGGTLGFGLRYQYPVAINSSRDEISSVLTVLKGRDAYLNDTLRSHGLDPFLMVAYWEDDYIIMRPDYSYAPDEVNQEWCDDHQWISDVVLGGGGIVIDCFDPKEPIRDLKVTEQVTWVTPSCDLNSHGGQYIAYGNEASIAHMYGDLCLMVRVGPPGSRGGIAGIS